MARTACCACGSASIDVDGPLKIHAVCHCTNCRRRTGSAFGWSAYFPREALVGVHGDLVAYAPANPPGGVPQVRHFCARCGTTLYWLDEKFPTLVGVAAGCFVEPLPAPPSLSASHAQKCDWVALPDALRRIED